MVDVGLTVISGLSVKIVHSVLIGFLLITLKVICLVFPTSIIPKSTFSQSSITLGRVTKPLNSGFQLLVAQIYLNAFQKLSLKRLVVFVLGTVSVIKSVKQEIVCGFFSGL